MKPCGGPGCMTMIPADRTLCQFCSGSIVAAPRWRSRVALRGHPWCLICPERVLPAAGGYAHAVAANHDVIPATLFYRGAGVPQLAI